MLIKEQKHVIQPWVIWRCSVILGSESNEGSCRPSLAQRGETTVWMTWPSSLCNAVWAGWVDRELLIVDQRYAWSFWPNQQHKNLEHFNSHVPIWFVWQADTWNIEINERAAESLDGCGIAERLRNRQTAAESLCICQNLNKTVTH